MAAYNIYALKPGTCLQSDEKYKIIDCLGQGGFGITYSAFFKSLDKKVAIKEFFFSNHCSRVGNEVVPHPQLEPHFEKLTDDFRNEAKTLAKIPHPNIPNVTDVFEENGTVYFVMEFIEGTSLKNIIDSKGRLPEDKALDYIKQVSFALKEVHAKGLVHRDVKPDNILITSDGKAILIDFGAARDISEEAMSITGILTHGYAPPEQYKPKYESKPSLDIYSLGSTLFHCVTGQRPAESRNRFMTEMPRPRDLEPQLTLGIDSLIWKAMDLDPMCRFQTILEFAYAWNFPPNVASFENDSSEEESFSKEAEEASQSLSLFLNDVDTQAFILVGPESSEKYQVVKAYIAKLEKEGRSYSLMAPVSRVANSLCRRFGLEVKNVYSSIYNFEAEGGPDSTSPLSSKLIPLGENRYSPDHIFIVLEAQLLSDSYIESSQIKFGSGKLLHDFLSFRESGKKLRQKIILVGDNFQLLRGAKHDQSINPSHLNETYGLELKYCELPQLAKNENNITSNCNNLVGCIKRSNFNALMPETNGQQLKRLEKEKFWEVYSSYPITDSVIICFSNQQVSETNSFIRKKKKLGAEIQVGDWVVMHNSIRYKNDLNSIGFIPNGEMGRISFVAPDPMKISQHISGELMEIEFKMVELFFPRIGCYLKRYILVDFLNSQEKEVELRVFQAIQIYWKEEKKKNGGKAIQISEDVDPLLEFALVKYAYAQTCHRVQGLHWDNVFINCDSGNPQDNEAYFRWLYTAISRGTESVFLINPPKISPFQKIEWNGNAVTKDDTKIPIHWFPRIEEPVRLGSIIEGQLLALNLSENDIQKWNLASFLIALIEPIGWSIKSISHKQYQEEYGIQVSKGKQLRVVFWYDGDHYFTKFSCINSDEEEWPILKKWILDRIGRREFLKRKISEGELHSILFQILSKMLDGTDIAITQIRPSKNHVEYTFESNDGYCICNIFSNDKGFYTSIVAIKSSSDDLLKKVEEYIYSLAGETLVQTR